MNALSLNLSVTVGPLLISNTCGGSYCGISGDIVPCLVTSLVLTVIFGPLVFEGGVIEVAGLNIKEVSNLGTSEIVPCLVTSLVLIFIFGPVSFEGEESL